MFRSFIGLVIFVSAMLVSGVVQDYKESEKIASQIFSAFQSLTTAVQVELLPFRFRGGRNSRDSRDIA